MSLKRQRDVDTSSIDTDQQSVEKKAKLSADPIIPRPGSLLPKLVAVKMKCVRVGSETESDFNELVDLFDALVSMWTPSAFTKAAVHALAFERFGLDPTKDVTVDQLKHVAQVYRLAQEERRLLFSLVERNHPHAISESTKACDGISNLIVALLDIILRSFRHPAVEDTTRLQEAVKRVIQSEDECGEPVVLTVCGPGQTGKTSFAHLLGHVAGSDSFAVTGGPNVLKQLFLQAALDGSTDLAGNHSALIVTKVKKNFGLTMEQFDDMVSGGLVTATIRGKFSKVMAAASVSAGAIYRRNHNKPTRSTLTATFNMPQVVILSGNEFAHAAEKIKHDAIEFNHILSRDAAAAVQE